MENKTIINKDEKSDYIGTWHEHTQYKYTSNISGLQHTLHFAGLTTGCGLGQISGITDFTTENIDEIKEIIQKISDRHDVGALLCTLGQPYYNRLEPILLKLGFKEIAIYNNYRHMYSKDSENTYTQKLYIYTI